MTRSDPAPRCALCGHVGPLQQHHIASRAIAPDAVVDICRACHEALHARNAPLWRAPRHVAGPVELARLGLHRLSETVEFCRDQSPSLFVDGSLVVGAVCAYQGARSIAVASVGVFDTVGELLLIAQREARR